MQVIIEVRVNFDQYENFTSVQYPSSICQSEKQYSVLFPTTGICPSTFLNPSESDHKPNYQSFNDPCIYTVGENITSPNHQKTIQAALNQKCADGYEITLVDYSHSETITVDKAQTAPVVIKGGYILDGKLIHTQWSINSSSTQIIQLNQGDLTLQNLEFKFTIDSKQKIQPPLSITTAVNKINYQSLTITSCIFNGIDTDSYEYKMIDAPNIDIIIVTDCTFQNALSLQQGLILCISNKTKAELIFEKTTFTNMTIKYPLGFGPLAVFLNGTEQKLTVNRCIFTNCSSGELGNYGGALYITSHFQFINRNEIIITNNKFINNTGYQTGGFYCVWNVVQLNFSNNEFIGNTKVGSDQKGCDVIFTQYNYSQSISQEQSQQKVIDLFKGCTSTFWDSLSYSFMINLIGTVSGYIDFDISVEYCKSKAELTASCICYEYYTQYPVDQCVRQQLCITDLIHQTAHNCPCLSTGDPRAGKQCPVYCTKGDVIKECTCDTNDSGFIVAQCQLEKRCKFDLIHQEVSDCSCLSTGDPRANGTCPAYCDKGNVTTACACDTNKESFTAAQCKLEKACKFDLSNQSPSDCPCLPTADPRQNKTCPPYCIRGYATSNCTCDTNLLSYPVDSCLKEKNCSFELINQSVANCPCQATGDPRAGGACPSYCKKGQATTDCVCDYYIPDYTVVQCQKEKSCITNLINQTTFDCPCMSSGDPRAGKACPSYCVKGQVTSECVCDTNQTGFTVTQCNKEKLCLLDLIHQTTSDCPCQSTGDPRAGKQCQSYCLKGQVTSECICDTNSSNYTLQQCQKEKLCITDLIHQSVADCACLSTGDPRAGNACPAYCIKGSTNQSCICDTNATNFPVNQCLKEKACKYDLANQTVANCPCLSTGDPRVGKACPSYCTAKDTPNANCACDSNSPAQYPPSACQEEKQYCLINSNSSISKDSCICTCTNYPYGCKCPTDPSLLSGIPKERCYCRSWGDPRAGKGEFPAYCQRGYTNLSRVCDTSSSSYPSKSCKNDKLCIIDLVHQTKTNCPCLMKGDPRAGSICRSYCKSKSELTIDCICELESPYPQATCERDKLCIVDLIHQSTNNCPCLDFDDPRGEQICNRTDIPSDPDPTETDPTDPIIPNPTEQEQQEEINKEEDESKKKESSTSTIIWIIFV
ncbi:MAG: hypothetical protein EZS28_025984, partial [Streblomastix strix]